MTRTLQPKFEFRKLPRSFQGLSRLRPLRIIQDDADYEMVRAIADVMVGREDLTEGQQDYLDTLLLIMERFEDEHEPVEKTLTPLEALKYLMEQNDMSASDLGRLLGNRPLGAAILRGDRSLSKTHIAILAEQFKVNPSLFLERVRAARSR
jgi:HTH-type transcriptional regulator/antitoxin HigA